MARLRCSCDGNAVPVVEHRHLDVFQRRRAGKQVEALKDKADFLVAHIGQLVAVEGGNVNAVQPVMPAGRPVQAPIMFIIVDLPEPLAPMMATNSPREDLQRNAAHGVHVHLAGVIRLVDVVELDDGFGLHGIFGS